MAFKSETYRVLIASPSDLTEERDAATDVVNEWNVQHAAAEGIVLLPVKWETHAIPQAGIRPQEAINRQFVRDCDVLVGMFWTKLGTSTGVAESGTVEEIDQFVTAKKPAMLYVSSRPIDPNKIDLKQHKKLKAFKAATYRKALVGGFTSVGELRQTLLRDLTNQVRQMKRAHRAQGTSIFDKIEREAKLTEIMIRQRRHKITQDDVQKYREELLGGRKQRVAVTTDPLKPGEKGPNAGPVEYMPNGDKVEWITDEDENGKPVKWPMLLRRNDNDVHGAIEEFFHKVWWNRHQNWLYRLETGKERLTEEQKPVLARAKQAARRIERKYGKKNLGWDDFEWGMVNGKLSALRWVMGDEWDFLDT